MTNTTKNNPTLISAIRIAYRVAWLLPSLEAAELVREIARSWKVGTVADTLGALGALQRALNNMPGGWTPATKLARARGAISF